MISLNSFTAFLCTNWKIRVILINPSQKKKKPQTNQNKSYFPYSSRPWDLSHKQMKTRLYIFSVAHISYQHLHTHWTQLIQAHSLSLLSLFPQTLTQPDQAQLTTFFAPSLDGDRRCERPIEKERESLPRSTSTITSLLYLPLTLPV